MALFYADSDDTPTKIGKVIGGVFSICVYLVIAWLMLFPFWH